MGLVYAGYDPFHDRKVAIKVCQLGPDMDEGSARVARKLFFNEAHMADVLDHTNIVGIYDAGEEAGEPYIVMEYVDGGKTLADYCQKGNLLPIASVADIVFKCAKALDYAHRRGVVHRDIKPSNIMLGSDGEVKICDFGVAHLPSSDQTQVLGILGSPMYMSPEQLKEETTTCQSDLYSLGAVMFELLAGQPPFQADGFTELMQKIVNEPPPSLSTIRSDLPASMEKIVRRALAKDVGERYQSGGELASDLVAAFLSLADCSTGPGKDQKFDTARKLAIFNEFSDEELREVLSVAEWETYGPGDGIMSEGSKEDSFCILVTGDVIVSRRNKNLAMLAEGNCFGEMGYLSNTDRSASVEALNDVALLRITASQMEHALESCHKRFNRVFLRTLVQRLESTSDDLIASNSAQGNPSSSGTSSSSDVITGVALFRDS
jgi:serine/threonine protein kinase